MSKITDFIIWLEENWPETDNQDDAMRHYVEFVLRESIDTPEEKPE